MSKLLKKQLRKLTTIVRTTNCTDLWDFIDEHFDINGGFSFFDQNDKMITNLEIKLDNTID